jgi:hypothetical protein
MKRGSPGTKALTLCSLDERLAQSIAEGKVAAQGFYRH